VMSDAYGVVDSGGVFSLGWDSPFVLVALPGENEMGLHPAAILLLLASCLARPSWV